MTLAERILWAELRYERIAGLRFRRPDPFRRFVLDFCCPARKLVIEVDGAIHDEQTGRDAERDRFLSAEGFRVLRFRNEQVIGDLGSVLREIRSHGCPPPFMGEGPARSVATSQGGGPPSAQS